MQSTVNFSTKCKATAWKRLASSSYISARPSFFQSLTTNNAKSSEKVVTRAMSVAVESNTLPGLPIDLRGHTPSYMTCLY